MIGWRKDVSRWSIKWLPSITVEDFRFHSRLHYTRAQPPVPKSRLFTDARAGTRRKWLLVTVRAPRRPCTLPSEFKSRTCRAKGKPIMYVYCSRPTAFRKHAIRRTLLRWRTETFGINFYLLPNCNWVLTWISGLYKCRFSLASSYINTVFFSLRNCSRFVRHWEDLRQRNQANTHARSQLPHFAVAHEAALAFSNKSTESLPFSQGECDHFVTSYGSAAVVSPFSLHIFESHNQQQRWTIFERVQNLYPLPFFLIEQEGGIRRRKDVKR